MKNSFFDYKNNKKVYKTKMSTLVRYLFILVLTLGFAFELGKNALSIESIQSNYKKKLYIPLKVIWHRHILWDGYVLITN